jgi:hypothetical protein
VEKELLSKWTPKQTGMAVFISDKADFKQKLIKETKRLFHINTGNNPSRGNKNC